jgi:hypothetical protein
VVDEHPKSCILFFRNGAAIFSQGTKIDTSSARDLMDKIHFRALVYNGTSLSEEIEHLVKSDSFLEMCLAPGHLLRLGHAFGY